MSAIKKSFAIAFTATSLIMGAAGLACADGEGPQHEGIHSGWMAQAPVHVPLPTCDGGGTFDSGFGVSCGA
ncbi:chaplin family protein [Streptomyces sp. NPDC091027]|uniref:chaplin family protein n=1 Tax=Streptomyces sp. NPDC091027 TaxID=3365971 RepID=UPI00380E66CE